MTDYLVLQADEYDQTGPGPVPGQDAQDASVYEELGPETGQPLSGYQGFSGTDTAGVKGGKEMDVYENGRKGMALPQPPAQTRPEITTVPDEKPQNVAPATDAACLASPSQPGTAPVTTPDAAPVSAPVSAPANAPAFPGGMPFVINLTNVTSTTVTTEVKKNPAPRRQRSSNDYRDYRRVPQHISRKFRKNVPALEHRPLKKTSSMCCGIRIILWLMVAALALYLTIRAWAVSQTQPLQDGHVSSNLNDPLMKAGNFTGMVAFMYTGTEPTSILMTASA